MKLTSFTVLTAVLATVLSLSTSSAAPAAGDACQVLGRELGGKVHQRNYLDLSYLDSVTKYYNARQSLHSPRCVVYPQSAQDVSVAIKAIRAANAKFAIKAGGHNTNDLWSSVEDGVLIHLKDMTSKSYDPATKLGSYQPGGRWIDVYNYFVGQQGRAVLGGRLPGIGTGLALGAGLSYLSSEYGLVCDNFVELEVVTPDGQIRIANDKKNSDLFWALRGGSNQFGIVTKFTVMTYPTGQVYAGNIVYAPDKIQEAFDAAVDFAKTNTDPKAAIIGTLTTLPTPSFGINADRVFILFAVYNGPDAKGAYDTFLKIPHVLNTIQKRNSYLDAIQMLPGADGSEGAMTYRVAANRFDGTSYKAQLEAFTKFSQEQKGKYNLLSLDFQPVPSSLLKASAARGGNILGLPKEEPFYWLNFVMAVNPYQSQADYDAISSKFKATAEEVPSEPGLPLFLNDSAEDQNVFASYSTYERLKAVKAKYDPDGFFKTNTRGPTFV